MSPAHGRAGARATLLSFYSLVPTSEKTLPGFQQAGKKEGGWGEGIFARLLSAPKARQGWEAARPCSKKVRTSFSNCDQSKHCEFCGQFVCSLAPPAAGLRSHFSVYFGTKSNGRTKSKISFLSSRRRFGAAKPPEQKHTFKKIIEMFLLSNFFRVPRCGTTKPVF